MFNTARDSGVGARGAPGLGRAGRRCGGALPMGAAHRRADHSDVLSRKLRATRGRGRTGADLPGNRRPAGPGTDGRRRRLQGAGWGGRFPSSSPRVGRTTIELSFRIAGKHFTSTLNSSNRHITSKGEPSLRRGAVVSARSLGMPNRNADLRATLRRATLGVIGTYRAIARPAARKRSDLAREQRRMERRVPRHTALNRVQRHGRTSHENCPSSAQQRAPGGSQQ